jgi:hypothetical protein
MRRSRTLVSLATCLLVLGACGGDDDTTTDGDSDAVAAEPDADDPVAAEPDDDADQQAAPTGGQGSASLTLDNGESFEFSVLCALEPQMAAGSEILFAVVSYDDTGLDITQFGDEGVVTGSASISVYDSSYETMWEAASLYEPFGGTIELSKDGSTVRGNGSFYPGGDPSATPVDGEVVANC